MHIQPKPADSSTNALDRTDVLPVLDVEAYEDALVEKSKSLSRTDTWTVEALRDIKATVDAMHKTLQSGKIKVEVTNFDQMPKD